MDKEVDFTVTLLTKESVMEVKDGIWLALPATYLSTTSNFYFYPHHSDHNILIYYHSTLTNLRVSYLLWKYDSDSLAPSSWPFPGFHHEMNSNNNKFKPTKYIAIDH